MEMSDSVAIRASSAVVSMFERSGGTNEDIRDAIAKAMLEEREICAKLAEANHTLLLLPNKLRGLPITPRTFR